MSNFATFPRFKAWRANGITPANGYKLYTYESGTTTPKNTYSDDALTTPNANPVILDSIGEATIFLGSGSYRFDLYTSNDSLVWTFDPISGNGVTLNTVNTVIDLKALSSQSNGTICTILGHTTIGDGGEGVFRWDAASSATDNNGTVIEPNSSPAIGRWVRLYSGNTIMSSWFGSESTAFANIISAINTSPYTLIVNSQLELTANRTLLSNVSVVIDQAGSFIADSAYSLTINGKLFSPKVHWIRTNVTLIIDQDACKYVCPEWWGALNDGTTNDIAAINAALVAHKYVKLTPGSGYLIRDSVDLNSGNILFSDDPENCELVTQIEVAGTSFPMISASAKSNWKVIGIGFDNSVNYPDPDTTAANEGNYSGDDFDFPTIAGINVDTSGDDWEIIGCKFNGLTTHGIRAQESASAAYNRVKIKDNRFYNGAYAGKIIAVYGRTGGATLSNNIEISGNISYDSGPHKYVLIGIPNQNGSTDGIHVDQCEYFTVENNQINKCAGVGIRIEQSKNGIVSGNSITESGQEGISVYSSCQYVSVVSNTIKNFGRIPNFGYVRVYNGQNYIPRETPDSSLAVLPADPSASEWFELNPYYLAGISNTPPTYSTSNYYDSGTPFAGTVIPPTGFNTANTLGMLAFRGYAGISVTSASTGIQVRDNVIVGNLTQTGGLYNYASDFGISIVHAVNSPQDYDANEICSGNLITGVINTEIYQPRFCDPVNQRGTITNVQKKRFNYSFDSTSRVYELGYDLDPRSLDSHWHGTERPLLKFDGSNGYIKGHSSSRPSIGTSEFGVLIFLKLNAALNTTSRYLFDSGDAGGTGAGIRISIRSTRIQFRVCGTGGGEDLNIEYTGVSDWGTSPRDALCIYAARDSDGLRMSIFAPDDPDLNYLPEIAGAAGAASYNVDSTNNIGIGVGSNATTNLISMDLYQLTVWTEAFTYDEIRERLNRRRLIKSTDSVVFNLEMAPCGKFYKDSLGNAKIIYQTATGITPSKASRTAHAVWRTTSTTAEWVTGVDQACLPSDFLITHLVCNSSGAANVTVGTTSGGTEILGSTAVVSGNNVIAVDKVSSNAKLSVKSDATVNITWSFCGYLLNQ